MLAAARPRRFSSTEWLGPCARKQYRSPFQVPLTLSATLKPVRLVMGVEMVWTLARPEVSPSGMIASTVKFVLVVKVCAEAVRPQASAVPVRQSLSKLERAAGCRRAQFCFVLWFMFLILVTTNCSTVVR